MPRPMTHQPPASPFSSRDNREAIAALLAEAGRAIVLPGFAHAGSDQRGPDGRKADGSVVTETDERCQQWLADRLRRLHPGIPLLGEEMPEADQRAMLARGGRCWCLDPLDGTSNFVAGIPCFALSLALIEDGRPLAAWIHDPVRGETFHAERGRGASLNGQPLAARAPRRLAEAVGFLDFKRLSPALAARFATNAPARSLRNLGSCALEWAWLAAGRGAFIVHGGEKLWDFAAGCLLVEEAGGIATDFAARPLSAKGELASPVLAAANAGIHREIEALLEPARD